MKWTRRANWAKWACTLAAVLAVGFAVFSGFYRCTAVVAYDSSGVERGIGVDGGLLFAAKVAKRDSDNEYKSGFWISRADRWMWGAAGDCPSDAQAGTWHWGVVCYGDRRARMIGVSLLYPVFLTAMPAALLWYTDRRRSGPHACKKCNYDRRGLPVGAKCPECGTVPARG